MVRDGFRGAADRVHGGKRGKLTHVHVQTGYPLGGLSGAVYGSVLPHIESLDRSIIDELAIWRRVFEALSYVFCRKRCLVSTPCLFSYRFGVTGDFLRNNQGVPCRFGLQIVRTTSAKAVIRYKAVTDAFPEARNVVLVSSEFCIVSYDSFNVTHEDRQSEKCLRIIGAGGGDSLVLDMRPILRCVRGWESLFHLFAVKTKVRCATACLT